MANIRLDVALTFAVCLELFAYGIYTTLFGSACVNYLTRRMLKRTHSTAWIFVVAGFVMFILATLHLALEIYRYLQAFITPVDPRGGVSFMYDFTKWVTILSSSLFGIMSWFGNALVIIRCYYVWNKKIWLVMAPVLLLVAMIGCNIFVMYFLNHVEGRAVNVVSFLQKMPALRAIYILSLIQNLITTGLISLKIYIQHTTFGATPPVVTRGLRPHVDRIINIMVESAMFYTLQILLIAILYLCNNNAQFMIQSLSVPTTGIIFLFISIRVLTAKETIPVKCTGLGNPEWLGERNDDIEFSTSKASITPGAVVSLRVSADNLDRDDYSEPSGSSSFTHKRTRNHSRDSPV